MGSSRLTTPTAQSLLATWLLLRLPRNHQLRRKLRAKKKSSTSYIRAWWLLLRFLVYTIESSPLIQVYTYRYTQTQVASKLFTIFLSLDSEISLHTPTSRESNTHGSLVSLAKQQQQQRNYNARARARSCSQSGVFRTRTHNLRQNIAREREHRRDLRARTAARLYITKKHRTCSQALISRCTHTRSDELGRFCFDIVDFYFLSLSVRILYVFWCSRAREREMNRPGERWEASTTNVKFDATARARPHSPVIDPLLLLLSLTLSDAINTRWIGIIVTFWRYNL